MVRAKYISYNVDYFFRLRLKRLKRLNQIETPSDSIKMRFQQESLLLLSLCGSSSAFSLNGAPSLKTMQRYNSMATNLNVVSVEGNAASKFYHLFMLLIEMILFARD